jgi:hypothetical protein
MDMAAGLANVVAAFAAVPGVETASTDPADVIAPGVLVQLVSIGPDTLGNASWACRRSWWSLTAMGALVLLRPCPCSWQPSRLPGSVRTTRSWPAAWCCRPTQHPCRGC